MAWLRQSARMDGAVVPQVLLGILERLELLERKYETQRLATLDWGKDVDKLMRWIDDHLQRIMALEQLRQDKMDRLIEQDREDDDDPQTLHTIALRMVDTLKQLGVLPEILDTLRRAIREPMQQPTPEAAPVATDEELFKAYPAPYGFAPALRAVYDLGRKHGAAQAAPPAMQRLMDAPMDARGYVDLRGARLAPPYSPEGELVEPASQPAPPAGGLVERVTEAIISSMLTSDRAAASAAIREVAAWLEQQPGPSFWIRRLREEADR